MQCDEGMLEGLGAFDDLVSRVVCAALCAKARGTKKP